MTSHEYPERLLPKSHYKSKIESNILQEINPFLQRKCELGLSECCVDENLDFVTPEAFGKHGLHGMSVNLLGGLFETADAWWHQDTDESDNWEKGDIDISNYEGKYHLPENEDLSRPKLSVYFKYKFANNLKWSFPRQFADKAQFDKYKDAIVEGMQGSFNKKTTYKLSGHTICEHVPTCLNYWHMQLTSIIDSKPVEEIESNSKSYQKRALHCMIEVLRLSSSLKVPSDIPLIELSIYQNS